MKVKKKHITTALATLLLVSPIYFSTETKTKAIEHFKEFYKEKLDNISDSKELSSINQPLEIPEVSIIGEKNYNLEELDIHEPAYIKKRELRKIVDSLYQKINISKEIPRHVFIKLIEKESSYNIYAHHKTSNARGLGQIREKTWETLEKKVSYKRGVYKSARNIETSLKFLKWIANYNERFNPNWKSLNLKQKQSYILATYNWGPGNLRRASWNLKKAPAETKNYISYILKP